ncbi:ribonuclease H-like domain-containing protein [Thelonectria olida]|uniref:ribonuclease H n=1 Tax=Thelonectria olida TaxID=1576542 RepID=A0A9P8WBL0_9HYPO|nr:ribonuclease H-like domain-containing protein [Thelonectria olida]
MDDSDSDDGMGPVELPDGRLVCRPHGFVVCGRCCVDYSFMDEVLESEDEAAERLADELYNQLSPAGRAEIDARWGPPSSTHTNARASSHSGTPGPSVGPTDAFRRGTGRVLPTKFVPPSATSTPGELFPLGLGLQAIPPVARFIRRDDPEQFLIYTDGACLNNGQANPKAGWACVFRPESITPAGIFSGRLENKGPFGDEYGQTSNRAELRAVLAALRFRHWVGEGFTTLVLATDSEYVAKGATEWARGWVRNGWRTRTGGQVKNKDLWEILLGEAERWDGLGLKIQFWRISRESNVEADRAAKEAAENEVRNEYANVFGILC